jgi:hypothetical protein
MSPTLNLQHFEELGSRLGSRLGEEIGNKLVAKLGTLRANKAAARQFKCGVPFADLSRSEATELVEVLPFVTEYSENAEAFAAKGIGLDDYLQSRLYDDRGCPFPGCVDTIPDTLRSAMRKQSELFAAKYPVRQPGLL